MKIDTSNNQPELLESVKFKIFIYYYQTFNNNIIFFFM